MKILNPEFEAYTREKIALNRFMQHLGLTITEIEPGLIKASLSFQQFHEQQDGWVHGGVSCAVADIVAGFAAYTLLGKGERVVTAEAKNTYLRVGKGKQLIAIGKVIKAGSRFHFCESEIYMDVINSDSMIIKGSSTMAIIR